MLRQSLVSVLAVAALTTGCDQDKEEAKKNAAAACPSQASGTASTPLPADLPVSAGLTAYQYAEQGKTRIWFAKASGGTDRIVPVRDGLVAALKAKGYRIKGTDQEQGAEAEAEFTGPHDGTLRVRPLCQEGQLEVRFRLES